MPDKDPPDPSKNSRVSITLAHLGMVKIQETRTKSVTAPGPTPVKTPTKNPRKTK